MTELSPAAQAVLDAAYEATRNPLWQTNFYASYAAAVLQVAADLVLPGEPLHAPASPLERGDQRWRFERDARQTCRQKLLTIVAELKAHVIK
jgi:hypothetical protein